MSESIFSYNGYELIITFETDAVRSECKSIHYYWRHKDAGEAVTRFKEFIDSEYPRRLVLKGILPYQQKVWEEQDNLEAHLEKLGGFSFYSYTIPGIKDFKYKVAVHEDYQEAFQNNKNGDFPSWAVIRIF